MVVIRAGTSTAITDQTTSSTHNAMINASTILIGTIFRDNQIMAMINRATMLIMAMTLLQTTFQPTRILLVLHSNIVAVNHLVNSSVRVNSSMDGANTRMDSTVIIMKQAERPATMIVIIGTAIGNSEEEIIILGTVCTCSS